MNLRIQAHIGALALLVGVAGSASAQLGALFSAATTESSGVVDVDGFIKNALSAEALMRTSLDQMSASLATKEELARINALKQQAAEKTDAREKNAIEQEILKTEAAMLNAKDFDKLASEDAQKLDARQKRKLAGSAFNFTLAVLRDRDLVGQSQTVLSSVSGDPTQLGKLGKVKDATGSLKTQLELASALATKVPKVFKAVGVKKPPSKASDAPVASAD